MVQWMLTYRLHSAINIMRHLWRVVLPPNKQKLHKHANNSCLYDLQYMTQNTNNYHTFLIVFTLVTETA